MKVNMSDRNLKRKRSRDSEVEVTEPSIDNTALNIKVEKENSFSKRKRYSIADKAKILKESETQNSLEITKKYGITRRCLQKWKRNRDNIIENSQNNVVKNAVTLRKTSLLDDTLYAWLIDTHNKGIPVTGPMIKQKAIDCNRELGGREDFKASYGWLRLWRKRKNVQFVTITGDELSADIDASEVYKHEFRKLLATAIVVLVSCLHLTK